jgi:outer membrane protein OmpA-like peptidoglycan-associated protein
MKEKFPELKFKKGYEYEFIDILPAKSGLYRLSTTKTYAYHIGNNLDEFTKSFNLDSSFDTNSEINITNSNIPFAFIPYKLKTKFYLILKKIFKF